MPTYDVAVIIINYNSSKYTIDCINSIVEHTSSDASYGISVIDNASSLDDYNNLVTSLSNFNDKVNLHLFRSRINTGFSTGNMLGLQFISAKYYFFLNNDCQLKNDCLSILLKFCEEKKDVGLCSPQLYNTNNEPQPCFDYFPFIITKILGIGILRLTYGKRFIKRKGIYTDPVRVDVVSGSQMFIRASAFDDIGGFDTMFFLYCEEEDIALRLSSHNYKTYLVPEAINTHVGGASTTRSLDINKEFYISFLYFYRKHFGYPKQLALRLILIIRLLRKGFSNPEHFALAYFVAIGANFKYSLRHRQKIQQLDPNQQLSDGVSKI